MLCQTGWLKLPCYVSGTTLITLGNKKTIALHDTVSIPLNTFLIGDLYWIPGPVRLRNSASLPTTSSCLEIFTSQSDPSSKHFICDGNLVFKKGWDHNDKLTVFQVFCCWCFVVPDIFVLKEFLFRKHLSNYIQFEK